MILKDLIADVNVNEIYEHIETETLSEWVNAWQKAALSALRPVSRERVEKAEWIWSTGDVYICSSCGEKTHVDECVGTPIYNFCPFCMAPMTDEAVDIRLKELEALKDGKGD